MVKRFRHAHNLKITLRCGADNHLGTLPRRDKLRRFPVHHELILILSNRILDLTHGP